MILTLHLLLLNLHLCELLIECLPLSQLIHEQLHVLLKLLIGDRSSLHFESLEHVRLECLIELRGLELLAEVNLFLEVVLFVLKTL